MKIKLCFIGLFVSVVLFLFSGCGFEFVSQVTIENNSDHDVENISLTHPSYGQVGQIGIIQSGTKKTVPISIEDRGIKGNVVLSIKIEYFIDGVKFDENNALYLEDSYLVDGNPIYSKSADISFGDGYGATVTIKNEGYLAISDWIK